MRALTICALAACHATACYAPSPQAGSPCVSSPCPSGLACSPSSHTCELAAVDAVAHDMQSDGIPPPIDTAQRDSPDVQLEPMLVQQIAGHLASASQLSVELPAAPASGSLLILVGANVSGPLERVVGGGAQWTRAARSLIYQNIEIWYGVTDGSDPTVTIELAGSVGASSAWVGEWTNLDPIVPLDVAVADDGATSPAMPGPLPTTHAHDLLIFGVSEEPPNTFGVPSPAPWTAAQAIDSTETIQHVWYQVVHATSTFVPKVDETSHTWDAAAAAFRAR